MKLPICALSTLMKRVTRSGLDDGCVFDFNERRVFFTEDVGVLISSFTLFPYEKKEKSRHLSMGYSRKTVYYMLMPRHANDPLHSLDQDH